MMKHHSCAALVLAWAVAFSAPAQTDQSFQPLFNGKDLTGWVAVNTAPSTWTVEEGMILCSGKPIGEMRTKRMYQNFILELDWRHMKPKGNAGVFIWADDITARGQPFHRAIEVQVLENACGNSQSHTVHGDIFPIHGAIMTPINGRGGSRAFPTEERSNPSPEWNHYRIECIDGEISLAVNGKLVTRGRDCSPRKGYICLESEGGIVHYRNLRIKELPGSALDPEHIAIADRGYRCLYTGLDFSGWKTAEENTKHWISKDWVFAYDGKSKSGDASIVTEEIFGDFGFVVDVRLDESSDGVSLLLRDSKAASIVIDREDPKIGPLLGNGRGWHRVEGMLKDNRLSLSLNGKQLYKDVRVEGVEARGPFRIVPKGPVEFANVYVREL